MRATVKIEICDDPTALQELDAATMQLALDAAFREITVALNKREKSRIFLDGDVVGRAVGSVRDATRADLVAHMIVSRRVGRRTSWYLAVRDAKVTA